jgi:hypothetical protein
MCTDAYREALTRDLTSTASSVAASTSAPSRRHATEAGREGVAGRPAPDEAQEIVLAALAEWDEQAAALARVGVAE